MLTAWVDIGRTIALRLGWRKGGDGDGPRRFEVGMMDDELPLARLGAVATGTAMGDKRTFEMVRVDDGAAGIARLAVVETGKRASALSQVRAVGGARDDGARMWVVDEEHGYVYGRQRDERYRRHGHGRSGKEVDVDVEVDDDDDDGSTTSDRQRSSSWESSSALEPLPPLSSSSPLPSSLPSSPLGRTSFASAVVDRGWRV